MLDLILSILLGLFLTALSVWGGHVSIKSLPAGEDRRFHRWVFTGFGIAASILTVCLGLRTFYKQREADSLQGQLQNSLTQANGSLASAVQRLQQSLLSQEFMKGQLSGLSIMVGKLGSDSTAGTAALSKALLQISTGAGHAAGLEPPGIEKMTNKQLQDKVIAFTADMHHFIAETAKQEMDSMNKEREMMDAAPEAKKSQVFDEATNAMFKMETDRGELANQLFLTSATMYRDELIRRLGPQPPPDDGFTFFLWHLPPGHQSTQVTLTETANYLETVARRLPIKG